MKLSPSNRLLISISVRHWGWILGTIVLSFWSGIFNGVSIALLVPGILAFLGQKIDLGEDAPDLVRNLLATFDGLPESQRASAMIATIIAAILIKNILSFFSTAVSGHLSRALVNDATFQGIRMLLGVGLDFYNRTKAGDLIQRLGSEMSGAVGTINTIVQIVATLVTLLTFIGLLISISWQLTIISSVFSLLVVISNQRFAKRLKEYGKQGVQLSRRYTSQLLEAISGIRLIKATSSEEMEYHRLTKTMLQRQRVDLNSQTFSSFVASINELLVVASLLAIVGLGRLVFTGTVEAYATILLTYLFLLSRVFAFVTTLGKALNNLALCSAAVDAMVKFLGREGKHFVSNGALPFSGLQRDIRFENVSFAYPNREKSRVLDRVNLCIPRGSTLALVGSSGAGKSTLADLMIRFYDPTQGRITIDGQDLRTFDLTSLHGSMGIVSQDTFLFNDTVLSNILYGCADGTEERAIEAAKRANAYDFIMELPEQFETMLGDRGVRLSGGQQQRIAIARALLRDPDILILDEATSALDTVSERQVQQAINELSRDRTVIVIAHRLSTIQNADQIAVLDKGQVVEVGNHADLLSKRGYYARLYAVQFSEGAAARSSVRCDNAMEALVLEETLSQLSTLEANGVSVRCDTGSVMAWALNRLPSLYAATREGAEFQKQVAEDVWRATVRERVTEAIAQFQESGWKDRRQPLIDTASMRSTVLLERLSYEGRSRLNAVLGSLALLADGLTDSPQEEYESLKEAYRATMQLLATLDLLDDAAGFTNWDSQSSQRPIARVVYPQARQLAQVLEVLASELIDDLLPETVVSAPEGRLQEYRSASDTAIALLDQLAMIETRSDQLNLRS
jgi:subfamily B ATP-binding cassette protein MsbA